MAYPKKYVITLTCGHKISVVTPPRFTKSRYCCNAGQGCGYSLGWVSFYDGTFLKENRGMT